MNTGQIIYIYTGQIMYIYTGQIMYINTGQIIYLNILPLFNVLGFRIASCLTYSLTQV